MKRTLKFTRLPQFDHLEERCLLTGNSFVDPILEWNGVALEANRVSYSGGVVNDQLGPTRSSRALAIVHAAMFDAWNSINRQYVPYLTSAPNASNASADAAIAQAAHDTLVALYPHSQALIDTALNQTLARVPDGREETRGIAVGQFVAQRILQARANDGSQIAGEYIPDGQPGHHNVDPLNPNQGFLTPAWGSVKPFTLTSPALVPTPTVPSLTSLEYSMAFTQVQELGALNSATRTTDQTEIGIFWGYDVARGLGDPPRLYNQVARAIATQEGNTVGENARLFALINLTMADAGIQAWGVKYRDDFWRPVVAIRQADGDGNPNTLGQPDWAPLGAPRTNPLPSESVNFTPPFPAYTSGHATFGAATFKTLANFYRTDDIRFSIPFDFISDEFNGVSRDIYAAIPDLVIDHVRQVRPRHYTSFSQASAENAASRIFLGIHWRFDATEGVSAGNRIADYAFDNYLQPSRGPGRIHVPSVDGAPGIDAYLNGTYSTFYQSAPVTHLSAHEDFLNQIYLDVLGRPFDEGGRVYWMDQMSEGMERSQVVTLIENSAECMNRKIQDAYQLLLGRDADPVGLTAWMGVLERGGTITDVRAGIAASVEFNSNGAFLDNLYNMALSRAIDTSGQAYWSGLLQAGISQQDVARAIFNSEEFLGGEVSSYYREFLGREASAEEIQMWIPVYQKKNDTKVLAGILGSVEYFDHGALLP